MKIKLIKEVVFTYGKGTNKETIQIYPIGTIFETSGLIKVLYYQCLCGGIYNDEAEVLNENKND